MFISIKKKIGSEPKLKQWLWFIGLWLGGLAAMLVLSGVIKTIIGI